MKKPIDPENIKMSWTKNQRDTLYILSVYRDAFMRHKIRHKVLKTTSYTIDKLPPGKYYWQVAVGGSEYNIQYKSPIQMFDVVDYGSEVDIQPSEKSISNLIVNPK